MDRITIIGMSPIGISIGLALKRNKLSNTEVVGSAADRQLLSTVMKTGALDKTENNLKSSVEGAQLVILDAPLTQTRELLEVIGPILEEGCVVTDTGTTKLRVMGWAAQYLRKEASYVGGHPLIKKPMRGLEDADASVFEGVSYCIMPAGNADDQSVKTVVALVEALGAKPLFLDANEHDSYAVAMTLLPMVLSSALVTATAGSDSWREMHRLAAADFAEFSRAASNDPGDNEAACLANPEALVHWIDQVITALYSYRNQIKEGKEELLESFIRTWEARARWEAGVVTESSSPALPSARESMASAFLGERIVKRYQQFTEGDKKRTWKYIKKS